MPPIREWQLTVGGATIAGIDEGPDDTAAVLLLHGQASTRRWWDPVAARLAARHRVVRFDQRGHGQSSAPAGGYTVDNLAADAIDVLGRLGLTRVVLAGHSLGAAVALSVAATRPDLVAGLACVEGGVYDPKLIFGNTWTQARTSMLHARRGRTTLPVLRTWLAAADLPADLLPILAANYTGDPGGRPRLRLDPAHEAHLAHSLWAQDPVPLLASVQAPVLVVAAYHGDERHDRPRRESIRRAHQLLGDRLQTRWVTGGHDLPLQRPAVVAGALMDLAALAESPV